MATLMLTPDMIAETWLGATACALGSQMCKGMMPAFEPKPTSDNTKIAVATPGVRASGLSGASKNEPLPAQAAQRSRRGRVLPCA